MRVILSGGLGYIGSHTCLELIRHGFEPCIIDNLSNSSIGVLDNIERACGIRPTFHETDIRNEQEILEIFKKEKPSAVVHFAGLKDVNESFEKVKDYYAVNVQGTLNLLNASVETDVENFVFSSSAAVYGIPETIPVVEGAVTNPISPYGKTKLIGEEIISDFCQNIDPLKCVLLRYFNPVGAHPGGHLGESPKNRPSNLMPVICRGVINNETIKVFGSDYPTKDGTGVRDYIHVVDLARSHVEALKYLEKSNQTTTTLNIGTGTGYSVLEMIKCFEDVNGVDVLRDIVPRRDGDAAECYADNKKALACLNWKPEFGLEDMCRHSWQWVTK